MPIYLVNRNSFHVQIGTGKYLGSIETLGENKILAAVRENDIEDSSKMRYASEEITPVNWTDTKLTENQRNKIEVILRKSKHLFSKNKNDLGYY